MNHSSQEVVLVRHGETEWSRTRRHTGRTDIPLTPEGRRAAEELKPLLAKWDFEHVFTSPLQRARTTCELAGFGSVAQAHDELMEWNYGRYEGRTTEDIRHEIPGWDIWRDGPIDGETASSVGARADRIISEVRSVTGNVLIFGHAHMSRILTARWLGLPAADGRLFMMETAAICVLGYEREQPVIIRWNERQHRNGN